MDALKPWLFNIKVSPTPNRLLFAWCVFDLEMVRISEVVLTKKRTNCIGILERHNSGL